MMTQANNRLKKSAAPENKPAQQSAAKSAQHTADPAAVAAATKLREANILVNLKSPEETQEKRCDTDRDATLPLQYSIPLNMSLVDRLIRMPLVAGPSKGSYNASRDYVLSSDEDLSIWHRSDDAHRVLLDFPLQTAACRPDFPCFVLWALSGVLPAVYARLIGESFGPSHEVVHRQLKELPAPIPYDDTEPPFEFRHGQVFGSSNIHPAALVHTFISGATGVGKTYGGVKPLLQSFLAYKSSEGKAMGMLVIDPKSELRQVCAAELAQLVQSERLFVLGKGKRLLFYTAHTEAGIEERYRMLAAIVQIKAVGESAIWQEKGHRLNIDVVIGDRRFQLQTGVLLWGVVRSLIEGRDCTHESQWANILAIYKHVVCSKFNLDWVTCVSHVLMQLCPGLHAQKSPFAAFAGDSDMQNQLFYRVSNAEKVCADLSSPEVTNVISTDLYPDACGDDCSVEDLLNDAKVLLLQPRSGYFGDIVGRLVKARFFAEVLARSDMMRPVGYVADEFQRFITADRDTGEQSFLDRCRAYRVNCVLATQSLASIEHALTQNGEASPRLAVDIIVANSPTKVIYRSVDSLTQQSLREWIPPAPAGRSHIVDARPVAQLPIGSAYYMCNGNWGLYRYNKLAGPAPLNPCSAPNQ